MRIGSEVSNLFHAQIDLQQLLPATLLRTQTSLGIDEQRQLPELHQDLRQSVPQYMLPMPKHEARLLSAAGSGFVADQDRLFTV